MASTTSVLTFDPQSKPGLSSKIKTRIKLTLLQKKVIYNLAAIVIVLGGTASLISISTSRQPTEQAKAFQTTVSNAPPKPVQASFGLPERLKIPKINVDAPVEHVSITPEGDMETPKGPTNVGWYQHGPRPGEIGSSVIDGHFGYKDRIPAVFDNLHTLQKGDKIYIEDEAGMTITFVARELRTYGPTDNATDVFRSGDGKAHLNLITCQGTWNADQQSYSNRLVVFADRATQ